MMAREYFVRNESGGGGIFKTLKEAIADRDQWLQREHAPRVDEPPVPPHEGIYFREVTGWRRVDA